MPMFRSLLVSVLIMLVTLPGMAAETDARKTTANGVTVAVTPNLRDAQSWEFKIVLDTHTQELSDDLMKTAVLLDPNGKRHAPTVWEGAAGDAHHREGV